MFSISKYRFSKEVREQTTAPGESSSGRDRLPGSKASKSGARIRHLLVCLLEQSGVVSPDSRRSGAWRDRDDGTGNEEKRNNSEPTSVNRTRVFGIHNVKLKESLA
jgi:hypothetical protein